MGWMNNTFGGGYDNPADSAQPYLDQIPGYVDKYMDPYINMGQEAGGIAQDQYAKWVNDPYGAYNEMYSNYDESPSYEYQSDQMQKAAESSAASGGMAGTEEDYTHQMTVNNALMDQDMSKYMDYILGMQKSGLQGEQQMYNTGYGASSQALQGDIGYADSSASNQFAGTESSNAMSSGMLGMLGKTAGLGTALASMGGMFSGTPSAGDTGGSGGGTMGKAATMAEIAAMFM